MSHTPGYDDPARVPSSQEDAVLREQERADDPHDLVHGISVRRRTMAIVAVGCRHLEDAI
jgi:hypothetical protein